MKSPSEEFPEICGESSDAASGCKEVLLPEESEEATTREDDAVLGEVIKLASQLDVDALNTTIIAVRKGIRDESVSNFPKALYTLSILVLTRFLQTNQQNDLVEGLYLRNKILRDFSNFYRDLSGPLHELTVGVTTRILGGQVDNLEAAFPAHLELHRFAHQPPPHRQITLASLEIILSILSCRNDILHHGPANSSAFRSSIAILQRDLYTSSYENDLNVALIVYRVALKIFPTQDPNHSSTLNNLATTLWTRFERGSGRQQDLDKAVDLHRECLKLRPLPHPDRSDSLNNLAAVLQTRYRQEGQHEDLDEAVVLQMQALALRPKSHPKRSDSLNNLAVTLISRHERFGRQEDLNEAVELHREALALRTEPHPDRPVSLSNLACVLLIRFGQGGQQEDVDEAVVLHVEALALRAMPHPHRPSCLNNLANALSVRFKVEGQHEDLDAVVELHREALALRDTDHPDRAASLTNLSSALQNRFVHGWGQQQDVNEAITLEREALTLRPHSHPERWVTLVNLANALLIRFGQGHGQQEDIDEAVKLHRQALALQLPTCPDLSSFFFRLAIALQTRCSYGLCAPREDLDEAIALLRKALVLRPIRHPEHSSSLTHLAVTLQTRFTQAGCRREDLDEAIMLFREAVALQFPHQRTSSLANLANALYMWSDKLGGHHESLNEAIALHRENLTLPPTSHPQRPGLINNLAVGLRARFKLGRKEEDLVESIELYKQALALVPASHPDRCLFLVNLSEVLAIRFVQDGALQEDFDEALSYLNQSLEEWKEPHPDRAQPLSVLAHLYIGSFLSNGVSDHLEKAIVVLSEAAHYPFQHVFRTFRLAKQWARHADQYGHPSALDAYDAALYALPQLAAVDLDVSMRHDVLLDGSDGLARKAARCAIQAHKLGNALEYLEIGRAVFWSQMLQLRPPFEQLHDIAPALEERLRETAANLEEGSHRFARFADLSNEGKLLSEQEDSRFSTLAKEWSELLSEVRRLPGFEDFLLPRSLSSLQATLAAPVVILVANDDVSDCLIITTTTVHHIPLPNLRYEVLRGLVSLVINAASGSSVPEDILMSTATVPAFETLRCLMDLVERRGSRRVAEHDHISSDDAFRLILRFLWKEVVKPVIDFLDIKPVSKELPIVQWCLTGPFTFLPIHAAGCYDQGLPLECTADYFISSYTPTIGALSTEGSAPPTQPFKMMAVVESHSLPNTRLELERIRRHVPNESLVAFGVGNDTTTSVETVASRLSDSSIVHFACHGKQHSSRPLDSGLQIGREGSVLTISRIMKEAMPNGSLAFLSACETAMGDQTLPDEAMSLAASLLFSGFHHVVATLWSIQDDDGPVVADSFYQELFRHPDGTPALRPDTTRSALALHVAVQTLRSKDVPFRRWVPFIHMGS